MGWVVGFLWVGYLQVIIFCWYYMCCLVCDWMLLVVVWMGLGLLAVCLGVLRLLVVGL